MLSTDNSFDYIMQANPDYTTREERYKFLLESYMGGEMYRNGDHLTRYTLETAAEYGARLNNTPLDNHCKSIIATYISFLFREQPYRDYGTLTNSPVLEDILYDADMEGRSFDAFMKEVSIWSGVFGHSWVLVSQPSIEAQTAAEQQAAGVRPYLSILTPLVVLDWQWDRLPNGRYELVKFKYVEDINGDIQTVRCWYPDYIETWEVDLENQTATQMSEEINGLGYIPAVIVYNQRSMIRGIGLSDIDDIADQQRAIYNEMSEIEQAVRLGGHPSLVITPDTQIGAGAGSLIEIPENLDPGLKPYTLSADGTPIDMIYKSIQNRIEAIDKMANTGGVRATESRTLSGVAMEVEFQLLNARLSEKADNLELAEEQIWKLVAAYQNTEWTGEINYPGSFSIRDTGREYTQLQIAKNTATDAGLSREIDRRLAELMGMDPDTVMTGGTDATVS